MLILSGAVVRLPPPLSLVSQSEQLPAGPRDVGDAGDDCDPQTVVPERPLRHGVEVACLVAHQILVPAHGRQRRRQRPGGWVGVSKRRGTKDKKIPGAGTTEEK